MPDLEDEMAEVYIDEDEMYLGEATLAKLRAGELEFPEGAGPASDSLAAPEETQSDEASLSEEPAAADGAADEPEETEVVVEITEEPAEPQANIEGEVE
jgi:hypothetical protein